MCARAKPGSSRVASRQLCKPSWTCRVSIFASPFRNRARAFGEWVVISMSPLGGLPRAVGRKTIAAVNRASKRKRRIGLNPPAEECRFGMLMGRFETRLVPFQMLRNHGLPVKKEPCDGCLSGISTADNVALVFGGTLGGMGIRIKCFELESKH